MVPETPQVGIVPEAHHAASGSRGRGYLPHRFELRNCEEAPAQSLPPSARCGVVRSDLLWGCTGPLLFAPHPLLNEPLKSSRAVACQGVSLLSGADRNILVCHQGGGKENQVAGAKLYDEHGFVENEMATVDPVERSESSVQAHIDEPVGAITMGPTLRRWSKVECVRSERRVRKRPPQGRMGFFDLAQCLLHRRVLNGEPSAIRAYVQDVS